MRHFFEHWMVQTVAYPDLDSRRTHFLILLILAGLFVLAVISWRENLFLGLVATIFVVPVSAVILLAWAVTFVAPYVRAWQQQKTRWWLDGVLRDRREQQAEGKRIMMAWDLQPNQEMRVILRAGIWWDVVGIDRRGKRLLVQPVFDNRMKALVGEDIHLGTPFFMVVPPDTWTIEMALDWLWRLRPGFWEHRDEICEI